MASVSEDVSSQQPGKVHLGRMVVVLAGALLYLAGGGALAYYCFTLNAEPPEAAPAEPVPPAPEPEEEADPPTPSPPAPEAAAVDALEQRKIDNAIVKGVLYLKSHQLPALGGWGKGMAPGNGRAVGNAALPGLTLLECGVLPTDPVVRKAAAFVRKEIVRPEGQGKYDTYQRAVAILFLDRLGDPKDEELIQLLALGLLAGQHPKTGAWGYPCPTMKREARQQLLELLRDENRSLEQWRTAALKGTSFKPGQLDNSNTQFAILALWVAQRHKVPIDRSIALMDRHFRTSQHAKGPDPTKNNLDLDGSWGYHRTGKEGWSSVSRWPTMTCAGLIGLGMAHGLTGDPGTKKGKPLDDPAIQRALAMLGREINRANEKRPRDLYFLWSLERVGVLYNLPKIEGKDWYAWGRQELLPSQQANGSWGMGGYPGAGPTINTCFALLFLQRANLAADLTAKLRLLGG